MKFTKEELIKALRKSLPISKDPATQMDAGSPQGTDPMSELMGKLDAIAEAMAQILSKLNDGGAQDPQAPGQDQGQSDPQAPAAPEMPADTASADEEKAPCTDCNGAKPEADKPAADKPAVDAPADGAKPGEKPADGEKPKDEAKKEDAAPGAEADGQSEDEEEMNEDEINQHLQSIAAEIQALEDAING